MERSRAYQTLNLQPDAEGQSVADAYWRLVRQAKTGADDPDTRAEIERLNEAYAALTPEAVPRTPRAAARRVQPATGSGLWLLDAFADWTVAQLQRTRQRWAGRNPEIAVVVGATFALTMIALSTGAAVTLTLAAAATATLAIWAPWRRVG